MEYVRDILEADICCPRGKRPKPSGDHVRAHMPDEDGVQVGAVGLEAVAK